MRAYFGDLAALASGAAHSIGPAVDKAARLVADAALSGRTTFAFGNGGSATQAQHFAAELVVRYHGDRPALPAIALTADVAILTACANDYDYSIVFSRQIEALAKAGDVAVGLTTSGESPNVLKALEAAHVRGLSTIFFTGEKGRAEASSKAYQVTSLKGHPTSITRADHLSLACRRHYPSFSSGTGFSLSEKAVTL